LDNNSKKSNIKRATTEFLQKRKTFGRQAKLLNKKFSIKSENEYFLDDVKSFHNSLNQENFKHKINKRKKILVVDDNQFINDSIKLLMDKIIKEYYLDIEVIQASDGIDMIKFIVEDQKDGNLIECVFTDEYMEYINGSDAIKIIRDMEKTNKIKKILIFSISSGEDNHESNIIIGSGADNILGKPVSKNAIINCLKQFNIISNY